MGVGAAGPTLRALVVDDERPLAEVVAGYLTRHGYEVAVAGDGPTAVALARQDPPDLVVLDVMLPGYDGFEVLRRLRTFSDAYVLMLTARDDEVDTVVGLSVGADDYVVKPFSPRELMARVQALMRRPRTPTGAPSPAPGDAPTAQPRPQVLRVGSLAVDLDGRSVAVDDRRVELTRTEFDILAALAATPGLVVTRRDLVETVWGTGWIGHDHVIDVHVANLRRKLGGPAQRLVRTVRGVGFKLEEDLP
jgi:DNA-binding response OmpR family regulator